MKFGDLCTGDIVNLAGTKAVVMAIQNPHPTSPGFWLIVWYLIDEKRLTFDCLSPAFDLIPGSTIHTDGMQTWRKTINELAARR